MAHIFTKSNFENAVNSLTHQRLSFSNILDESRSYSNASSRQKTVFLSHSHYDARYVNMAKTFFEHLGISIYVDWADITMPQLPCGTTAIKIKEKIFENQFFVFLATDNAIASKWCNWEIGIGDIFKLCEDKIVILPLAESSYGWVGNEYLQIYPYISGPDNTLWNDTPSRYSVHYPDGREKSLLAWLNE